jgi:hypothetical protein
VGEDRGSKETDGCPLTVPQDPWTRGLDGVEVCGREEGFEETIVLNVTIRQA